jgi:hypothetical protein
VSEPSPSESAAPALQLSLGGVTFDAHRVIYATIILMTAYAIYDEGTSPFTSGSLMELFGVTVAPLFALTMAHAFSDALDLQIRNGRQLNRHDRRHLFFTNVQYLYVAIPPLLLSTVLALFHWDANEIVTIVLGLGVLSLFLWGVYAGRTAHVSRWRQAYFGFGYGIMGLFVIVIELILTH